MHKYIFIILSFAFPIFLFAQDNESDIHSATIEIGRQYTFFLKDGNVFKGTVTYKDTENIMVRSTSKILIYKMSDIARFENLIIPKKHYSLGVGYGIEYGIFGFNAGLKPVENLAISLGIGTTIFAGTGYSIGVKYYFRKIVDTWRPSVIVVYGTTGMLANDIDLTDKVPGAYYQAQTFKGVAIGVGQVWWLGDSKRHGLSLDFLFPYSFEMHDKLEEINNNIKLYNERSYYLQYKLIEFGLPVKISGGYNFSF